MKLSLKVQMYRVNPASLILDFVQQVELAFCGSVRSTRRITLAKKNK